MLILFGLFRQFIRVSAVDFPAVEHAYVKSVRRAIERASSTHNAVAAKAELAVSVRFDVANGTIFCASAAFYTLVAVNLEKSPVDFHCRLFDAHHPCHKSSERNFGKFMLDAANYFLCLDGSKLFKRVFILAAISSVCLKIILYGIT